MTKILEGIALPAGKTGIETKGFAGARCRGSSRFIETAMGLRAR